MKRAPQSMPRRRPGQGRSSGLERIVDFALGVPAIRLLGLTRRRRPAPRDVRRIGLLQTSAIGDTVLMTAAIGDLRRALPEATIMLVLGPSNASMAPLMGGIDKVVVLPVKQVGRSLRMLRELRLDVLIDFGPWPRLNAVYTALSGAAYTIGMRTSGQFRHYAYDATAEHRMDRHEIENQRALIAALGLTPCSPPAIVVPEADSRAESAGSGDPAILHPWPGGSAAALKRWPTERWVGLARHLAARGCRIAVTGAPADRADAEALVASIGMPAARCVSLAGQLSLIETVRALVRAPVVVSVDTGIMHLAAVAGARLVSLHGPTRPERWGPIGPRAIAIASPCPGCGYLDLGFDVPRNPPDCMGAITVEAVAAAVDRHLADRTGQAHARFLVGAAARGQEATS